jgi:hypothetical protein
MIDDDAQNPQEHMSQRGDDLLGRHGPFAILIDGIPVARASADQWIDACALVAAEFMRSQGAQGRMPTVGACRLDIESMNRLPPFWMAPMA